MGKLAVLSGVPHGQPSPRQLTARRIAFRPGAEIGIRGKFAILPNTAASPNGPFRFNVNTHSLLSVIDITTRRDTGRAFNKHSAVDEQTATPKRFTTVP